MEKARVGHVRRVMTLGGLVVGFLLVAGMDTCNCNPPKNPSVAFPPGTVYGTADPPRIKPPAVVKRKPLQLDPASLPKGANAQFPALDGDGFFITLPVTQAVPLAA